MFNGTNLNLNLAENNRTYNFLVWLEAHNLVWPSNLMHFERNLNLTLIIDILFNSGRPSQQFIGHVGTDLPVLNQ